MVGFRVHGHIIICNTVDREMFAVKKFSPLAQVAKICLRRIIRVTLPAVAKIKHAEIYHAKKKEREHFPIYGMSTIISFFYSFFVHLYCYHQ